MKLHLAFFLLCTVTVVATDLTGKWSGSFKAEGADHSISQLIILKQQGSTLSGSAGPDASEQYPIENGRVDGNKATFAITTGEWKFAYVLTLQRKLAVGRFNTREHHGEAQRKSDADTHEGELTSRHRRVDRTLPKLYFTRSIETTRFH